MVFPLTLLPRYTGTDTDFLPPPVLALHTLSDKRVPDVFFFLIFKLHDVFRRRFQNGPKSKNQRFTFTLNHAYSDLQQFLKQT